MKRKRRKLGANLGEERQVESPYSRVIARHLRSWHEEALKLKQLWIGAAYDINSTNPSCIYVGLGHRRGLYLLCEYGEQPIVSLFSVGPRGLEGRRKMIEYDDLQGNPHTAPVQCIVPLEIGLSAIEFFMIHDAVPLTVEWAGTRGMWKNAFLKPWW